MCIAQEPLHKLKKDTTIRGGHTQFTAYYTKRQILKNSTTKNENYQKQQNSNTRLHFTHIFGFAWMKLRVQQTVGMWKPAPSSSPLNSLLLKKFCLHPGAMLLCRGNYLTASHSGIFLSHPWVRSWHLTHFSSLSAANAPFSHVEMLCEVGTHTGFQFSNTKRK